MELTIVSGLSGAGKSKAASFLEDMGYYVADNIPVDLIPKFAQLCMAGSARYAKMALVTDIRGGQTFDGLFDALDQLNAMGCDHQMLFMEASVETVIKRYKETRRKHPLAKEGRTLAEAYQQERIALEPVRQRATYIVDTSTISTAKLKGEMGRLFGDGATQTELAVTVLSFGFKHGIPMEADLVFDVRFLPNPFYIAELKPQTGLDQPVYDFVFGYQQTRDFMKYLEDMVSFLLPHYVAEGKTALVIGIGCTGGHHRSVAVTKALVEFVRQKGYSVSENHRDMTRGEAFV